MSSRVQCDDGLTPQEARFVDEYFGAFCNGAEAARRAGYAPNGSPAVLAATASRLLSRRRVQEAIIALRKQLSLGAAEALARVTEIARASFDDFLDDEGNLDLKRAMRRGRLNLVKSLRIRRIQTKHGEGSEIQIELHNAQRALETLLKFHGMLAPAFTRTNLPRDEMELDRMLKAAAERRGLVLGPATANSD